MHDTAIDADRVPGSEGSACESVKVKPRSARFRIFEIDPLLQPLFEGIVLLAAVSLGALRVMKVKNTLELFR